MIMPENYSGKIALEKLAEGPALGSLPEGPVRILELGAGVGDGAEVMKKPSSGVLKYTQYRPAWWRMDPAHTPRP
jgi:hypothetical protein